MHGIHGKILRVDLGRGELKDVELKEDVYKKFLGGSGLGAWLLNDALRPGIDPLGPENALAFVTGPFTGSRVISSSRYALCGLSPLTGIWGEATSGGVFPVTLKRTGYDGIVITGKAGKPAFVYVHDGQGEIRDATPVWGKDTYETQEILSKDLGEKKVNIACIGQAGEKLVKYACVMNDSGRAAGRCGLGAVMGSKNLKAVVVRGDRGAEPARPEELKSAAESIAATVTKNPLAAGMKEYGTLAYIDLGMILGDVPTKYWTKGIFPPDELSPFKLKEKYVWEIKACWGCPIACGKRVRFDKRGVECVDGPEYETVAAFGPLCLNFDLDSIIYANHLCNAYGMDTISAGVSIAFAMYLFEKGLLKKDRVGFDLNWGDSETIVKLTGMIAKREGFGDLLAEGVRRVGETLGVDRDEVAHVKGLEIPMHDARCFTGLVIAYGTSPRGACHLRPESQMTGLWVPTPEIGIDSMPRHQVEGAGKPYALLQDFKELFDSLLFCKYTLVVMPFHITQALNAITGWGFETEDLMKIGERNTNLKRVINLRFGVTAKDDRLPKIALRALDEGSNIGFSPDQERMLRDYYEFRGWDPRTGGPTKEKLKKLGIENL